MRKDQHRPSEMIPEDYLFVAQECFKVGTENFEYVLIEKQLIRNHMAKTGGNYSSHSHGGNCMVCGSVNALYTIIFYHEKTNSYIRMGSDCAEKCEIGDQRLFKYFRASVEDALERKAGKAKAKALFGQQGLTAAYDLYESENKVDKWEENTIRDIVGKVIQYGNLSEKQSTFVKKLLEKIETRPAREAAFAAEKAAAKDCPTGRVEIRGTVLSTKIQATDFGNIWKMTVKSMEGFLVFGTIPSNIGEVQRGEYVRFTANITPSENDSKFGFFKRPTKALRVVNQ